MRRQVILTIDRVGGCNTHTHTHMKGFLARAPSLSLPVRLAMSRQHLAEEQYKNHLGVM